MSAVAILSQILLLGLYCLLIVSSLAQALSSTFRPTEVIVGSGLWVLLAGVHVALLIFGGLPAMSWSAPLLAYLLLEGLDTLWSARQIGTRVVVSRWRLLRSALLNAASLTCLMLSGFFASLSSWVGIG